MGPQNAGNVLSIAAGLLLLIGLWTPIAGSLIALLSAWRVFSWQFIDPLSSVLLGTIGAGLASLGPGAWSVDARLFGWKRVQVRQSK